MSIHPQIPLSEGVLMDAWLGLEMPRFMARAIVHLDARNLNLADGASVTSWPSRPGGTVVATAGSAPTYRATGLNSRPTVEFASGNWLDMGTEGRRITNAASGCTIFAVATSSASGDITHSLVHFSVNASGGSGRIALRTRNSSTLSVQASVRRLDADSSVSSGSVTGTSVPCICSCTVDYTAGTVVSNLNGVSGTAGTISTGVSEANDSLAAVIGSGSAAGTANRFVGFCSFVAVFPMVVSPLRQFRIRQYLGHSFGITTT